MLEIDPIKVYHIPFNKMRQLLGYFGTIAVTMYINRTFKPPKVSPYVLGSFIGVLFAPRYSPILHLHR